MSPFLNWWSKLLGLPVLASENGELVDKLIIYVHWLMIVLFIGWSIYFVFVLLRFRQSRNPKADHYGVKNHSSTYIEGTVAGIEVLLLFGLAVPYWAMSVDKFPPESEATRVQVVAQQFAWNFRYPGQDGIFGKQEMRFVTSDNPFGVDPADPNGKDDIQTLNEMHVPLVKNPDGKFRPVIAHISSKDVVHSFKVIALRVTQDAIPGMRIPVWFRPLHEGRYQINCAQLCGNGHSGMAGGFLTVESQAAYDTWLASKSGGTPQSFE